MKGGKKGAEPFPDFATYSPELPKTIDIHPYFGSTLDLILDAIIDDDVEKTSLPSLVLTDDHGRVVISVQIDPLSSLIVIKNSFDVRLHSTKIFHLNDSILNVLARRFPF